MDWKLRDYRVEDYPFIYELKKACYHPYVSAIWGWDEAVQRAYFEQFIAAASGAIAVIEEDGIAVGMVNWRIEDGVYRIENICIVPERRNLGLGGQVLNWLMEHCGYREIALQVFKTNPAGRLYRRLGFEVEGETEHHYQMRARSGTK